MTVAAILLSAAEHAIDGQPLALLPWLAGDTLIEYEVAQLEAAGVDTIEVVVGYEADRVIPLVARDNVEPIVHARWRDDVAGGVRVGATAVPRDTGTALILEVTQPRPASVHRSLLAVHAAAAAAITRPCYDGRCGWPLVVDAGVLAELRNANDDAGGLAAVLHGHEHETRVVEFSDEIVTLEIDSPHAYALLHLLLAGEQS